MPWTTGVRPGGGTTCFACGAGSTRPAARCDSSDRSLRTPHTASRSPLPPPWSPRCSRRRRGDPRSVRSPRSPRRCTTGRPSRGTSPGRRGRSSRMSGWSGARTCAAPSTSTERCSISRSCCNRGNHASTARSTTRSVDGSRRPSRPSSATRSPAIPTPARSATRRRSTACSTSCVCGPRSPTGRSTPLPSTATSGQRWGHSASPLRPSPSSTPLRRSSSCAGRVRRVAQQARDAARRPGGSQPGGPLRRYAWATGRTTPWTCRLVAVDADRGRSFALVAVDDRLSGP